MRTTSTNCKGNVLPGGRYTFTCPVCGKRSGDVTPQPDAGWWVGCWSCAAAGLSGGAYLRALAAKAKSAPELLLGDPLAALGRYVVAGPGRRPTTAPTWAQVTGWADRLKGDEAARAWLRARGVSDATVARYHLGRHENDGVVVPNVRRDGVVGGVIRRFPDAGRAPKYRQLGPVRRWFPRDPVPGKPAYLVVSTFDALLARQAGMPAYAANGLGTPTRLLQEMAGAAARVYVLPHVGEELAGEQIAEKLRSYGARAWSVPLALPDHGADVADWFVEHGRTARQLRARCRRVRRAA